MFNFHKPRVYRSAEGCCICRAKSSSSRFTDSRKYEQESMQCFNLKHPRHGEICNACVLLVKRYKRLPVGSKRHWGHVVDARAGPGTKSLAKQKKRDEWANGESNGSGSKSFIPEKLTKIFKKKRNNKVTTNMVESIGTDTAKSKSTKVDCSDNQSDSNESYDEPIESSATQTSSMVVQFQTQTRAAAQKKQLEAAAAAAASTQSFVSALGSKRRRMLPPRKNRNGIGTSHETIPFFEKSDLVKMEICCGIVYKYIPLSDSFVLDADEYVPCNKHRRNSNGESVLSSSLESSSNRQAAISPLPIFMPKPTVATMPAIMRLEPTPLATNNMVLAATGNNNSAAPTAAVVKSTPVLKKHHLFFKRQSENFPNGDDNRTSPIPLNKTESLLSTTLTSLAAVTLPTTNTATAVTTPPTLTTQLLLPAKEPIPASVYNASYLPRHSNSKAATVAIAAGPTINTVATTSVAGAVAAKSSHAHNTELVLKPTPPAATSCEATVNQQPQQQQSPKSVDTTQVMTTALGASSPSSLSTSSTCSSSSTTKFNDNSSDSGFDEHVQERKSASPPSTQEQEQQVDKKPPPQGRGPSMQRLILANGVQIMGQPQNLMLTGNEFAARIMQKHNARGKQTMANGVGSHHHQNQPQQHQYQNQNQPNINNNRSGNIASSCSSGSAPIGNNNNNVNRAIYNNSNSIQHENGVTTILPASSLAASNQTAAMNSIAPSTVTITPSMLTAAARGGTSVGGGGIVARKITLNGGHAQPVAINNVTNQKIVFIKAATAAALASTSSGATTSRQAAINLYKN